jgi:hypothetical protein
LVIWSIVIVLLVVWLAGVLAGKDGFIHLLFLSAIGIAVVQWTAHRRAARR